MRHPQLDQPLGEQQLSGELAARDALRADAYGGLSFGPGARPILKGEQQLTIAVPPPRKRAARKRTDYPADPMFDALREARRRFGAVKLERYGKTMLEALSTNG